MVSKKNPFEKYGLVNLLLTNNNFNPCEFQIPGECYQNGKPKSWPKYKFPTYGIEAETECLPLSYNLSKMLGKEPNPQVCCDLPGCNNCTNGGDFVCLGCYHTFQLYHVYKVTIAAPYAKSLEQMI